MPANTFDEMSQFNIIARNMYMSLSRGIFDFATTFTTVCHLEHSIYWKIRFFSCDSLFTLKNHHGCGKRITINVNSKKKMKRIPEWHQNMHKLSIKYLIQCDRTIKLSFIFGIQTGIRQQLAPIIVNINLSSFCLLFDTQKLNVCSFAWARVLSLWCNAFSSPHFKI